MNNKNKYHIIYCSNILKSKNFKELLFEIKNLFVKIKNKIKKKKIGIGLCLSNNIIKELIIKKNYNIFVKSIKTYNIYIPSINAFVYNLFHKKLIKEKIYYPDWTSEARFLYTKRIINFAKKITKTFKENSISTSPISYKPWINKKHITYVYYKSSINLSKIVILLIKINKYNRKYVHIDIEPEPCCLIEKIKDIIYFFNKWLLPISIKYLIKKLKIHKMLAKFYIKKYINICYDICHLSVEFENNVEAIKNLIKNKIKLGKIQISSAPKLSITKINYKQNIKNILSVFNKSPFLHQTLIKKENKIDTFKDIPEVIKNYKIKIYDEIRIHCHIPIYLKTYINFETTNNEIIKTINFIKNKNIVNILEIETYTYNSIFKNFNVYKSIIKEYLWLTKNIKIYAKNKKINIYNIYTN